MRPRGSLTGHFVPGRPKHGLRVRAVSGARQAEIQGTAQPFLRAMLARPL